MPYTIKLPLKFQKHSASEDIRIRQNELAKTLRKLELDPAKSRKKVQRVLMA